MSWSRKRPRQVPESPPVLSSRSSAHHAALLHSVSHDALLLPAEDEEGYLLVEEDTTDSSLIITMEDSQMEVKTAKRKPIRKRKRRITEEGEGPMEGRKDGGGASDSDGEEDVEIDRQLDQSLETKSKQHNLTTVNVRNIIHEVITNEHVVAMMKAAMNGETEAVPLFEPKMTRSKLKEVVQRGVVIPAWNISPIKTSSDSSKAPQFVDIPLAEEDSSDEEYRPEEDDEDETAEDTFQESDMESSASSPRGSRRLRQVEDCSSAQSRWGRLKVKPVSMGPPPPPKAPPLRAVTDSAFLEKLHAVEEELAVCMEPYQPLSESEDEAGLMAYRTRSKRPLRDVSLGRLEAELRAPDFTPDMYECVSTHEDREWTDWLRGLMTSDMDQEEECDDEDDPEYNFLADIDEPDQEDYRDDKAVRITKKEVNELMEELFETLKEDLTGQEVEDEGHEEEEELQEEAHTVQTHTEEQRDDMLLADHELGSGPITALHTVKQQLDFIRTQHTHTHTPSNTITHSADPHTLRLSAQQKRQLQQQLQQHVQLLTQVHLLTSPVGKLHSEAETTRQFLLELDVLAQRAELLGFATPACCSSFRASNLQGALQLLEELRQAPVSYRQPARRQNARGHVRCFPVMPAELAWIFATRPVFLHPELLPCASLDPALYCSRRTAAFTAAEDCLLVLGLRNMEESCDPPQLVSQFLLRKTPVQVRRRILQCCRPGFPDNIVKAFRYQRLLWAMPVACRPVDPSLQRPPVERSERVLPLWLLRSLPVIHPIIARYNKRPAGSAPETPPSCRRGGVRQSHLTFLRCASSCGLPAGTRYPPRLPEHLDFRRIGFVLLQRPLPPPADITTAISMATRQKIAKHSEMLARLRRRRRRDEGALTPLMGEDDVMEEKKEVQGEEEEEGDVLLALSESSDEEALGAEPEDGEGAPPQEEEDEIKPEDLIFAEDYLHRVCEALQESPAECQQLLQVLDEFSGVRGAPEDLYRGLSGVLRPWPQLLLDFAAFLNHRQAQRCGLLLEQQMFERSRHFLQRLGRSLGRSSSLYHQVVSALQGSSAPSSKDIQQVSSLLRYHPHLQQEVQLLLQELLPPSAPIATTLEVEPSVQRTPYHSRRGGTGVEEEEEEEEENKEEKEKEEEEQMIHAKMSVSSSGEKLIIWTREADRTILTSCQKSGANRRTFQQVSAHLCNRTAQQVRLRFLDLMKLFHSTSEDPPISRQHAPPAPTGDQSQSFAQT